MPDWVRNSLWAIFVGWVAFTALCATVLFFTVVSA